MTDDQQPSAPSYYTSEDERTVQDTEINVRGLLVGATGEVCAVYASDALFGHHGLTVALTLLAAGACYGYAVWQKRYVIQDRRRSPPREAAPR